MLNMVHDLHQGIRELKHIVLYNVQLLQCIRELEQL